MTDEAGGSRDDGGPNGQFTIFHAMFLAGMVMAIVMPAHDEYKRAGVPGLIFGLVMGVLILAPFAFVLMTAAFGLLFLTIATAIRLVDRLTGRRLIAPDAPAPSQSGDDGGS